MRERSQFASLHLVDHLAEQAAIALGIVTQHPHQVDGDVGCAILKPQRGELFLSQDFPLADFKEASTNRENLPDSSG